jgi:hypothetical protein
MVNPEDLPTIECTRRLGGRRINGKGRESVAEQY